MTIPLARPILVTNRRNEKQNWGYPQHARCYYPLWEKKGHHSEPITFYLANLGQEDLILGTDWLRLHNPDVNWQTIKSCYPDAQNMFLTPTLWFKEFLRIRCLWSLQKRRRTKNYNGYQKECMHSKPRLPPSSPGRTQENGFNLVPKEYQSFAKVFDEPSSRRFPKARPWDHAIDLKPMQALMREKLILWTITRRKHPGCSFPRTWTKVTFNLHFSLGAPVMRGHSFFFSFPFLYYSFPHSTLTRTIRYALVVCRPYSGLTFCFLLFLPISTSVDCLVATAEHCLASFGLGLDTYTTPFLFKRF